MTNQINTINDTKRRNLTIKIRGIKRQHYKLLRLLSSDTSNADNLDLTRPYVALSVSLYNLKNDDKRLGKPHKHYSFFGVKYSSLSVKSFVGFSDKARISV